jgi:hypothetical protein
MSIGPVEDLEERGARIQRQALLKTERRRRAAWRRSQGQPAPGVSWKPTSLP